MKFWLLEIMKAFAIPIILLLITGLFIFRLVNFKNQEISKVVLGVMLGVMLGFAADLSKRAVDDLLKKQRLRKATFSLLKENAKSVYRSFWLWDRLMKSKDVPDDVKRNIPPELNMEYWSILKNHPDFLMLGAEEPFDKIFQHMWNLEQINEQIRLAKQGRQEAAQFAITFYKLAIEEGEYKDLLSFFMTEKEIEEFDRDYIEKAKQRHITK
jgi:hypothetical protein